MRRLVVLACLAAVLGAGSADAELIDRVLATVGPQVITLSDARAVVRLGLVDVSGAPDPIGTAVQRLIERRLVLEEVERFAPPEPSADAIEAGMSAVRARFGSPAELAAAVRAAGIDERAVREWVRNDLRIERYIAQRFAGVLEPTPEELDGYATQHPDEVDPARAGEPDVQRAIREKLIALRREALVREWLEGLRRRAEITVNPPVAGP